MTNERWIALMGDETKNLTAEEIKEGWHFCHEFDGILRQPIDESLVCTCLGTPIKPTG
jgi:regulator of replication initiation timing